MHYNWWSDVAAGFILSCEKPLDFHAVIPLFVIGLKYLISGWNIKWFCNPLSVKYLLPLIILYNYLSNFLFLFILLILVKLFLIDYLIHFKPVHLFFKVTFYLIFVVYKLSFLRNQQYHFCLETCLFQSSTKIFWS